MSRSRSRGGPGCRTPPESDGTLSWLGLFAAAVLFAVGQAVRNGTVREALTAVALWTLIASARAGAAWATTALS